MTRTVIAAGVINGTAERLTGDRFNATVARNTLGQFLRTFLDSDSNLEVRRMENWTNEARDPNGTVMLSDENGELHCTNGPAVTTAAGDYHFYVHGNEIEAPGEGYTLQAVYEDGAQHWTQGNWTIDVTAGGGVVTRQDGDIQSDEGNPAVITPDGSEGYFIRDRQVRNPYPLAGKVAIDRQRGWEITTGVNYVEGETAKQAAGRLKSHLEHAIALGVIPALTKTDVTVNTRRGTRPELVITLTGVDHDRFIAPENAPSNPYNDYTDYGNRVRSYAQTLAASFNKVTSEIHTDGLEQAFEPTVRITTNRGRTYA